MLKTVLAAALLCALTVSAEARQHHRATGLAPECNVSIPCELPYASSPQKVRETRGRYVARQLGFGAPAHPVRSQARQVQSYGDAAVVAHPSGCPGTAFCGCGASVRIFGHSIRELWLAANWFKFPRTSPAPGMAAVRRHHVMVLEADLGGGVWQVYDANSGGHATRVHARSIAGYAIVNPHGAG